MDLDIVEAIPIALKDHILNEEETALLEEHTNGENSEEKRWKD